MNHGDSNYFEYKSYLNGVEFSYKLKIITDLTELCICPVCGAPDCGEELFLWAEFEKEKLAIHFGGATFRSFLNSWYKEDITEDEYGALPEFIKENNEGKGWADFKEPN